MGASGGSPYEVFAVRYGTRTARRSEVFLHHEVYGEPDAPMAMDYFFWVVRDAQRTVLVDCGFNEASGARRGRTMLRSPVDALAALGIAPAGIQHLVVTHGHYDHIGNLPAFPAATVVMSAREHAFWTGPLGTKPLFATAAEAADIEVLRELERAGRLRLISGRHTLADGIDLVELGGHTPGQLIVLVTTANGEVVLASDALHYYEELTLDRPFLHVADLPAMYTGFDRLRELGEHRPLVAGHDPAVLQRFPALAGDPDTVRIG